jgi:hypothetical protein
MRLVKMGHVLMSDKFAPLPKGYCANTDDGFIPRSPAIYVRTRGDSSAASKSERQMESGQRYGLLHHLTIRVARRCCGTERCERMKTSISIASLGCDLL